MRIEQAVSSETFAEQSARSSAVSEEPAAWGERCSRCIAEV